MYLHETVNKDVRYLRNWCPQTCSSVSGVGWGECFCCEPEEPIIPPPEPPLQCCVTRVIVRNSGRYVVSSNGSVQKVCC